MKRYAVLILAISMMSMPVMAGPGMNYPYYDFEPPFLGLPLGMNGTAVDQGSGGVLCGVTFGGPCELYAARVYYNALDMVCVFADIGSAEPEFAGSGTTIQGGATVQLPVSSSFRTTLTGAYAMGDFDGVEMDQVGVAIACSGSLASMPKTTLNGSLGATKTDVELDSGNKNDTTELTVSAGVIHKIKGAVKLFAQVSYMDGVFGTAGAGWNW